MEKKEKYSSSHACRFDVVHSYIYFFTDPAQKARKPDQRMAEHTSAVLGRTAWGKDYGLRRSLTIIEAGDWSACSLGISCSSEDRHRADWKVTD